MSLVVQQAGIGLSTTLMLAMRCATILWEEAVSMEGEADPLGGTSV